MLSPEEEILIRRNKRILIRRSKRASLLRDLSDTVDRLLASMTPPPGLQEAIDEIRLRRSLDQ